MVFIKYGKKLFITELIGDFNSARRSLLADFDEFFIEIITQYIFQRHVNFRKNSIDPKYYRIIERHEIIINDDIHEVLSLCVGKVFMC